MISLIKKISISFICAFSFLCASGKETICYKLINSSDSSIKTGAIQFISFIGDQCYESDFNGISVKNGILNKNRYQSNNLKTVYNGSCFCGENAKFEFNSNKQILYVRSKNGNHYEFQKAEKPKNVTTCSLIRINNDPMSPEPNIDGNLIHNYCTTISSNNNSSNSSNNSSNDNREDSYDKIPSKRRCNYCNGSGQIVKNDNASATFGIDRPKKQCPTCGLWYDPGAFFHYHQKCYHCNGTGIAK